MSLDEEMNWLLLFFVFPVRPGMKTLMLPSVHEVGFLLRPIVEADGSHFL